MVDILGGLGQALGFKKTDFEKVKAPEMVTDSADFGDIYTQQYQPGAQGITDFVGGPGFQAQWGTDPETGERIAQGDMAKLFQDRQARVAGGVKGISGSAKLAQKGIAADEQKRLDARLKEGIASVAQMSGGDLSRADKLRMSMQAGKGASMGRQDIRSQAAQAAGDIATADLASQEARLKQEQDLLGKDVQMMSGLDQAALGAQRAGLDVWAAPMQFQMGNLNQNVQNQFQAQLANQAAQNAVNLGQQQALAGTFTAGLSAATG